jgi:inosine-uridine nucleoside N-ribohydrolase
MITRTKVSVLVGVILCLAPYLFAPAQAPPKPQLVLIDTDIGDDIDDAFALGLALTSPELKILGITSAWADTPTKSRLIDRLLCETGRTDIPVATGIQGPGSSNQARWARIPDKPHPNAVPFLLDQIKQHPNEITLIALGPLTNIGAAIKQDPAAFRLLKRVIIMGGSVRRGYNDFGYNPSHGPDAEYNIKQDIPAARALFTAGVPLLVAPLDSTEIKLDQTNRDLLFNANTNLTDSITQLYHLWSAGHAFDPTLYDVVPVAMSFDPNVCPVTPLHLTVDDKGFTRESTGPPNTQVCLRNNTDAFMQLFMRRLLTQHLQGSCAKLP